jgi:hypothetical protein
MHSIFRHIAAGVALMAASTSAWAQAGSSPLPAEIAAPGEKTVITLHAQGAQLYECAATKDGKFAWSFREPIATLLLNGKTVGRHYAGPSWEMADGSAIVGKVSGRADGASLADIPLLKLEVVSRRGAGLLSDVVTIQRINTKGGVAAGACSQAGAFLSVLYSADYAFFKKMSASALSPAR